uniref:CHK kinase-like domain-containing protein n=1 Tax=Panagrolaimus davidi TaxID=227884 RepID=A0A914Q8L0_9BILA
MVVDKVDVNERINGHSITVGWLLDSLRKNDKVYQKLHGNRAVKEVEAYDISGGKGFASEILRCIIKFDDSKSSTDIYSTILKIPGFESLKEGIKQSGGDSTAIDSNDDKLKGFDQIHEFECDFYENLAPIFDVPVPKVFKTMLKSDENVEGCLHMEDLTVRGKTLTFFEMLNITQVKHIIRLLAHMHKNILSVDEKLWRGKYLKNQISMVKIIDMFKPMTQSFLKQCKSKDQFKPLYDRCQKIAESKEFLLYLLTEDYKSAEPVIVHGDLHLGNIMWNIDENGDIQNTIAAFIDWQTIFEGSPMLDLARLLTFCCDGGTRRQIENFAIEFYLECLTKEFNGDVSKVPYTVEGLKRAYNMAFLFQAFMTPGGIAFLFGAIDEKTYSKNVKDSLWDQSELKALHALQDADQLLQNELKDVYEKYGL